MSERDPQPERPGAAEPAGEDSSDTAGDLHARGVAAAQRGDIDQAIALITRAIELAPDHPTYPCHLADVLQAVGQLEGAVKGYARALELDPARIELHYNVGTVRGLLGDLAGAEAAYRRALTLDPDFVLALDNLGTVLQGLGRAREAEAMYRRVLELQPDNPWASTNLATVLCASGQIDLAEAGFRQVLAACPEFAPAHAGLATVLHIRGDLVAAEEACRTALELDPTLVQVHHHLGAVLLAAGKLEAAVAVCARAAKTFVNDGSLHSNWGVALTAQGRHREAAVALARAVELGPDDPEHHYNLGVVLERGGECERAIASYRRSVALDPTRRETHDSLGSALLQLGQVEAALAAYRAALAIDPDNSTARHMEAALTGASCSVAPPDHVQAIFDEYAASYDSHLVDRLGYRVPELVAAALDRVAPGRRFSLGLDLGCGTGLLAVRLGDRVGPIDGIDLSARMVAVAREKSLYRRLVVGEIVEVLARTTEELAAEYPLVTAADVLVYFGDLAPLMAAVRSRLVAGGLWVGTVERHQGAGYVVRQTGRFAHSRDYVEGLAAEHGLTVLSCETVVLRNEDDQPVAGLVFVLER